MSTELISYLTKKYKKKLEMMKIMPGWLPFNFKRWTAPLILNMATHRHTTESVGISA